MIKCFICSFHFANPVELCEHIKSTHQISGQASYRCTLCEQEFTKMWIYKRHLNLCFIKNPVITTSESVAAVKENVYQQNVLKFESEVYRSAVLLVCKLASNMNIPRKYVFELLEEFRNFYSTTILEGFNQIVSPHVSSELQINLNYILQICQDPFRTVRNEHKMDFVLEKYDLIRPLQPFDIIEDENHLSETDGDETDGDETDGYETDCDETDCDETDCDEVDCNETDRDEADCDETVCDVIYCDETDTDTDYSIDKECGTEMPLAFQFKKFFEIPKVYEETQKYAEKVSKKIGYHNFINGNLWKKKLKSYKPTDVVIPFHLHIDDTQINNSLGTHKQDGMLTCSYYSFPTVPPQFNSRLENVFVAQLHPSKANKKFGNSSCYKALISEFNKLALEGVMLNIDGGEQKMKQSTDHVDPLCQIPGTITLCAKLSPRSPKTSNPVLCNCNPVTFTVESGKEDEVILRESSTPYGNGRFNLAVYFVHGLFLGDNKGLNDSLGFAKSHSANYFCRFCRLHKKETAERTNQDDDMLRNEKNYIEDVKKKKFKSTGITEKSCFNKLHTSHVISCTAGDLMHDVNEGCLHYNMCEIILDFIHKGYFSLNDLNRLKSDLSYGAIESGNKSPDITWRKLKSKKLLMTASEMYSFTHHFALIVGDLIPKDDKVWQFYLKTIMFLDLAYLPSFIEEDIRNLARTTSEMNAMYIRLFNQKLKPKHHYLTHYPALIRRFGPLRFFTSMKFEAKHKMVKNYTKNIASRINVSHSLGRKFQYYFAHQLLSNVPFWALKLKLLSSRSLVVVCNRQ